MIRNSIAILVIATLIISGCASVGVTRMKITDPNPTNCSLDIYTSEDEIKRPYEILCLIDSRTGTTLFHTKTGASAIRQARPEACRCGADAILITNIDTEGVTLMTWGKGKAIIKAIRYTDK